HYPTHVSLHSFPTRRSSDLIRLVDVVARARDARLPVDDDLVADEPAFQRGRQGEERRGRIAARVRDQPRAADPIAGQLGQAVDGDRKSTRLNSSHRTISYAV